MAQAAPDIHNLREAYRKMYIALNIKDIDSVLPPEEEVQPKDPVLENMDALNNTPLQAFPQQNHDAHIAAHTAFLENPMVQQNPAVVAALQAHIQQHQALKYRIQIETILSQQGIQLPPPGQAVPPEIESQIAIAAAQATQQVTGQAQAIAQAEQAAMQDPQREMFEAQLQLEKEQLMQKENKDQRDADIKLQKIDADVRVADTKTAVELQELEQKAQADADKNYTELVKTVRESRKPNGE